MITKGKIHSPAESAIGTAPKRLRARAKAEQLEIFACDPALAWAGPSWATMSRRQRAKYPADLLERDWEALA